MLYNKLDEKEIYTFKLTNGEEVVSSVVSDNDDHYVLNKPCTVVPAGQGLGLVSTVLSANIDRHTTLYKHGVSFVAPTMDDMRNHYIKITTGIEPVTRGSIIT